MPQAIHEVMNKGNTKHPNAISPHANDTIVNSTINIKATIVKYVFSFMVVFI